MWGGIAWRPVMLLLAIAPSYGKVHNIVCCYAYFCLLWHHKRQKMIWWILRRWGLTLRKKKLLQLYDTHLHDNPGGKTDEYKSAEVIRHLHDMGPLMTILFNCSALSSTSGANISLHYRGSKSISENTIRGNMI